MNCKVKIETYDNETALTFELATGNCLTFYADTTVSDVIRDIKNAVLLSKVKQLESDLRAAKKKIVELEGTTGDMQ